MDPPENAQIRILSGKYLTVTSRIVTPSLRRVVLNRQGILAAYARLSTGRPLHRLRRRAGRLTQMFLRPF
jgi:hypothetical protein